eukprot:Sspe_Gene.35344::Locus_17133_Transcript_1_1_Confidence_1.000_Length_3093::g.35344::m.35344
MQCHTLPPLRIRHAATRCGVGWDMALEATALCLSSLGETVARQDTNDTPPMPRRQLILNIVGLDGDESATPVYVTGSGFQAVRGRRRPNRKWTSTPTLGMERLVQSIEACAPHLPRPLPTARPRMDHSYPVPCADDDKSVTITIASSLPRFRAW